MGRPGFNHGRGGRAAGYGALPRAEPGLGQLPAPGPTAGKILVMAKLYQPAPGQSSRAGEAEARARTTSRAAFTGSAAPRMGRPTTMWLAPALMAMSGVTTRF